MQIKILMPIVMTSFLTACGGAAKTASTDFGLPSSGSGYAGSYSNYGNNTASYGGVTLEESLLSGKTVREVYTKCTDKSTSSSAYSIRNNWVIYTDGTVQTMGSYYNDASCSNKISNIPFFSSLFHYSLRSTSLGTDANGVNSEKWTLTETPTYTTTSSPKVVYLRTAINGNMRCFGTGEGANITPSSYRSTYTVALLTGHENSSDMPNSVDFSTYDHCIQKIK